MYARKLFACTVIVLLGVGFFMAPGAWFRRSPTLSLAHDLTSQLIQGNLNGQHHGPDVPLDMNIAQPGDIILCHNAHGAYGYWTHAVLYVGREQVVDANDFSHGTIRQDVRHYRKYDEVILLRPKLPEKMRQQAAHFACSKVGTPYDPLGSLRDTHSAYCSKLIWEAYAKVGAQLFTARGWVLPDQFATSPQMVRIAHWSTLQGDGNDVGHQ